MLFAASSTFCSLSLSLAIHNYFICCSCVSCSRVTVHLNQCICLKRGEERRCAPLSPVPCSCASLSLSLSLSKVLLCELLLQQLASMALVSVHVSTFKRVTFGSYALFMHIHRKSEGEGERKKRETMKCLQPFRGKWRGIKRQHVCLCEREREEDQEEERKKERREKSEERKKAHVLTVGGCRNFK